MRELPVFSPGEVSGVIAGAAKARKLRALAERAEHFPVCQASGEGGTRRAFLKLRHACGAEFAALRSCDLRSCPRCNRRRFARACRDAEKRLHGLESRHGTRFLTLTQPASLELAEGLESMRAKVKLLRRRPFFKAAVRGGLAALQWTKYGETWHVHAHLVLVGDYIPRAAITEAWEEITGSPLGVDIRRWFERSGKGAYVEALGYVYPTTARRYARLEDYAEAEIGARGVHLIQPFGDVYKARGDAPLEVGERACPCCGEPGKWSCHGTPSLLDWVVYHERLADIQNGDADSLVPLNRKTAGERLSEIYARRATRDGGARA